MANYYDYSAIDVTDPEQVGGGLGDVGTEVRICVALSGKKINDYLSESDRAAGWVSLTPKCARELLDYLLAVEHVMPPSDRWAPGERRQRKG